MTLDTKAARDRCAKATPGPWQWEVNPKSRIVNLCGGARRHDLTVMDFVRWGMSHAAPRFLRKEGGHDLLTRCDEMTEPFEGREHHQAWFRRINHPDANFIAEARTDLPAALDEIDRLRAALNNIISTTAEPVIRIMAEKAIRGEA